MISVKTSKLGDLQVEPESIIVFSQGIPGFEEEREFVIYQPDEELPFSYLQSLAQEDLSFIVTDPFIFYPEYEFELSETIQKELQIKEENQVSVWVIVAVKDDLGEATMNLLAPLVINAQARLGKQVILHNTPYQTKHRLLGS